MSRTQNHTDVVSVSAFTSREQPPDASVSHAKASPLARHPKALKGPQKAKTYTYLVSDTQARKIGRGLAKGFGWIGEQWEALDALWSHESGWSTRSYGPRLKYGRACGIPQRYPCNGLDSLDAKGQIMWGLQYVRGRYGSPVKAWAHFDTHNWY